MFAKYRQSRRLGRAGMLLADNAFPMSRKLEAVETLKRIGGAKAADILMHALESRRGDVRLAAVDALGEMNDSRSVEPLRRALEDSGLRRSAAIALKKLGDPVWEEMIKGDAGDCERLAAWGDSRAVPLLCQALAGWWPPELQYEAAVALGEIEGELATTALIEALLHGAWPDCPGVKEELLDARCAAAIGLGKRRDPRILDALVAVLSWSISCEHPYKVWALGMLRQASAEALGILGDRRAIGSLVSALQEKHCPNDHYGAIDLSRCAAAKALGLLGGNEAEAQLFEAMGDASPAVRRESALALHELGQSEWAELVRGEEDDFANLAASGNPKAIHALLASAAAAFSYEDEDRVGEIQAALRQFGGAAAFEKFSGYAASANWHLRAVSAAAMGGTGDPRAIDQLIGLLEDEVGYVRMVAAKELGQLGDKRAAAPLISALGVEWPEVRVAAAAALARLGEPAWQKRVRGEDADFERLGDCGDMRALDPLVRMAKIRIVDDHVAAMNLIAVKALGRLGDIRAILTLVGFLTGRHDPFQDRVVVPILRKLADAAPESSVERRKAVAALAEYDQETERMEEEDRRAKAYPYLS
jgi:HEAT repeat protein